MLKDVLDRIETRLRAVGLSESAAAKRAGLSDSAIRNIRRAVEAGREVGVSTKTMNALAPILETTAAWLVDGAGPEAGGGEYFVPLMGYVGAGAEVEPEFDQVPPEGIDQISVPFPLPGDMIAFKVRGASMLPVFRDGTVIIVFREQRRALESFYGEEAAVRTSDGRRFIKQIMRGPGGGVSLFSWNAQPIEDVQLEWVGEIFAVLPNSALRRVERQGGVQGQLRLRA